MEDLEARNFDLDIKNPNRKFENGYLKAEQYIGMLGQDLQDVSTDIDRIFESFFHIKNYEVVELGEICSVKKGSTGIKKAIEGDYPLVTTAEERGSHESYQFDAEAVCIPLVSSTGHGHASLKRVHYQRGRFALGSILAAAVPIDQKQVSAKYLYYYLNNFKDEVIVPLMKGMANVSLSVGKIKTIRIVLPSFEDQCALVELMEKCEVLKRTLEKSRQHAEEMISVVISEALEVKEDADENHKEIVDSTASSTDYYKRTLLAAEIVDQLHTEPTLGHLKLQKLIFLCQKTQDMQLPTNFLQQAAGPYDPKMARSIDKQLRDKKWFDYRKSELNKYQPLDEAGSHKGDFEKYFADDLSAISRIIGLFRRARSEEMEAVATLYACWEELLESGNEMSSDLLTTKFYAWSEQKSRFPVEKLEKTISWMTENGIVPRTSVSGELVQ